ncbi:YhdT family protein [Lutispora saccharofermentans]|uniref:YhdT family protein n=1 Tax=Lutispora saccharofermentans TaxID=3024236 RepID=A0ABT1NHL4_9FIRM|nr:YhdT family protein [Lutispora saccharofermentans]MCQ1530729.1 YhdT family protein [Lutispora saccharofermentans]
MKKEEYYDTNYDFKEIEMDERFIICEKEMKLVFIIQILFTVLSVAAAYLLGRGNPEDYTYIMGLPAWWFAVISISLIFLGTVIYITKFILVDMDLGDEGTIEEKVKTKI